MSRFRKVRRDHESRKSTEAPHRGADQARAAGWDAGAAAHGFVPGTVVHHPAGTFVVGLTTGSDIRNHNHLNNVQNAYAQQLIAQQRAQFNNQMALMRAGVGLYSFHAGSDPNPQPPLQREIRAGELVAYRAWEIHYEAGKVVYESLHATGIWIDGKMTAQHAAGETVTDYGAAGVYAWKTLKQARSYVAGQSHKVIAIGEVELWGDVVEHDLGYRAERAKIRRIIELECAPYARKDVVFYINDDGMVAVRATNPAFRPNE